MKYFIKVYVIFFGLSNLLIFDAFGQKASWMDRLIFESDFQYGFIQPHHKFIAYLVNDHIRCFQVNVGIQTSGNKQWHYSYNFPTIGFGYLYSNLGADEIFGKMHTFYFYINRSYLNLRKKLNITTKTSIGLSYLTKKFDLDKNRYNIVIGSHLNAYLSYSIIGTINLTQKIQLRLGGSFAHISNGDVKEPNYGLNQVSAIMGITYNLIKYTPKKKYMFFNNKTANHEWLIIGSYGIKQLSRFNNYHASITSITFEYNRKITLIHWIGAAVSYYYYLPVKKLSAVPESDSYYAKSGMAFNLSYEKKVGSLSFLIQPGIYMLKKSKLVDIISNKVGLRYSVSKHINTCVSIKAHWIARADFIEWGIGYKL
jgi:hypothetical protein